MRNVGGEIPRHINMSEIKSTRPFSKDFVIRLTISFINRSIDMSINRTLGRIEEFADDQKKSEEVLQTLSELHTLKDQINAMIKPSQRIK